MIDLNSLNQRVEVDSRLPLRYYYRIADNLLRQASIYREEKNVVDLYVILLRFSSLVTETIPFHRDYLVSLPKERLRYRKISIEVLDELEDLKPEFQHQVKKLNEPYAEAQLPQKNGSDRTLCGSGSFYMGQPAVEGNVKVPAGSSSQSSWKYNNGNYGLSSNSTPIYRQLQKLSLGMPVPKKETLSRHSFLGPNGLDGQWLGSSAEIKVQYPSHNDIPHTDNLSLSQGGQNDIVAVKDDGIREGVSSMESVLSLDDGRWSHIAEEPRFNEIDQPREDFSRMLDCRQPSPPPVLAEVHKLSSTTIPPSRVADPRPGPARSAEDHGRSSYQHLHVPVKLMEDFLRLACSNTQKNLETCGVLAGSLKNRVFHISTLIIPKQESTSDSCQTLNEEEIFEIQDKLSLFPLGWIHTHPSQTCFMSSVDLHTHYSYQIMLPEAIAIVMAPTDTTSPHGIFHLSDPGGLSIIRTCQQRGFHPHEEPTDGSPIYEHCSHVYMNSKLKYDVVDLR